MSKKIKLDDVVVDNEVHAREKLNLIAIKNYAEFLKENPDQFPPIKVFKLKNQFILIDGKLRLEAHKQAGLKTIAIEIVEASKREARLMSLELNTSHGTELTKDDRRRGVLMILSDKEWCKFSNVKISRIAGVSEFYIRDLMKDLGIVKDQVHYVDKHGNAGVMNTADKTKDVPVIDAQILVQYIQSIQVKEIESLDQTKLAEYVAEIIAKFNYIKKGKNPFEQKSDLKTEEIKAILKTDTVKKGSTKKAA